MVRISTKRVAHLIRTADSSARMGFLDDSLGWESRSVIERALAVMSLTRAERKALRERGVIS